jgi:hypothetical protein
MTPCSRCDRPAEYLLYPHFAAYNASGSDRPREPICGHCVSLLPGKVERVSPFAFVQVVKS